MTTTTIKPSQVQLWRSFLPLVGAFGRAELEMAAAVIVLTCKRNGDDWQAVRLRQLGETLKVELEEGCLKHLAQSPFVPLPDFRGLVAGGFAECTFETDAPIALAESALKILETQKG